ncbi:hypothetical protein J6590_044795 [Homalodisca vitripennis]|nr:hypothetical protein J6590_044795 [Homalodisca vitripennis]
MGEVTVAGPRGDGGQERMSTHKDEAIVCHELQYLPWTKFGVSSEIDDTLAEFELTC